MRNGFSGFYGISEDSIGSVFTSNVTIFIFDANILLTLYRCEEETRNRFFEIWGNIKEQCWFPHQVCLEYQRNRLKVVKDSRDALDKITKKIHNSVSELKTQIFDGEHSQTISRYSNLKGELDSLFSQVNNIINEFTENHINSRKSNIDFLNNHDVIRDKIDELTDGRIGAAPVDQNAIDALNKIGKIRYKYKIGPGFDDSTSKKESFYSYDGINYDAEYGDYYVWNQILEYVSGRPGSNVVYVSNDAKSDFYYKIEGKIRGPNESLRTEIKKHGAAEFLLQNIDTFLHHANTHLGAGVEESIINELTNASNINKETSFASNNDLSNVTSSYLQYVYGKIKEEDYLDDANETYLYLKERLIQVSKELISLKAIDINTLSDIDRVRHFKKVNRNEALISNYQETLKLLASKIIYKQEAEAITQLRENE
ncbi:TPA: PIN-like domain-containing protein [Klebsiella pneumoniae]